MKAFVPSKELQTKINQIQQELKLEDPAEVISMALYLMDLALGREVEFKDKHQTFRTTKFAEHNQTVILEDGK